MIMHGHGSHRVAANHGGSLNVFVVASFEKAGRECGGPGGAIRGRGREAAEGRGRRRGVRLPPSVWGGDIDDTASFDFTVNLDRMTAQEAARLIVGALGHDTSSPARLKDAGREAEIAAS